MQNETARHIKRRFYSIEQHDDGTADVYLIPDSVEYDTALGVTEYDVTLLVVPGVAAYEGLEEDIREHYYDWCASAQPIGI